MRHELRRRRSTNGRPALRRATAAGATLTLVAGLLLAVPTTASAVPAAPDVTVRGTVYSGGPSTLAAGDPIAYDIATTVGATAPAGRLTVTATTPTGVRVLGAAGTGWACSAARLQSVSCVSAAVPSSGSTPGAITVTAVAIAAQSAGDAAGVTLQATDGTTTITAAGPAATGSNPTTPTVTGVDPAVGPRPGHTPVTITGTNLAGATAIAIGTTAQLAVGTAPTLVRCTAVAAPQCFTEKDGALSISSLPSGGGDVTIRVLAKGASASGSYRYADIPDAPIATATASAGGAQVSWATPTAGTSPITGYTVTALRNGTRMDALTRTTSADTTSVQFTGLDVGVPYQFQVRANSAAGDSQVGQTSVAVPCTLPSAPLSPTVQPGGAAGTLMLYWLDPTDDGNAMVTKYRITPTRNGVAQTPVDVDASGAVSSSNNTAFSQLDSGSSYTFTVAAINLAGQGPTSASTDAIVVPGGSPSTSATPVVTAPAIPVGQVNNSIPWRPSVAGGTAPYYWFLASGSLPKGLSISSSDGSLQGAAMSAGTFTAVLHVLDRRGRQATSTMTVTVRPAVSLSRTGSTESITLGTPSTLTVSATDVATAAPVDSGVVRFYQRIVGRTPIMLGTAAVRGGTASLTTTLPAGDIDIRPIYVKDDRTASEKTVISPTVTLPPGSLIITAFRTSGPRGPADQYAQVTNVTGRPIDLASVSIEGYMRMVHFPAATLMPGRSILVAGEAYPAATTPDLTWTDGLGTGQLVLTFAGQVVDSVGPQQISYFRTNIVPLPDLGQPTVDYSWIRPQQNGGYRNTGDNTVDFALMSADGSPVSGVTAMAGSASPQGVASPWFRPGWLDSSLLDPQLSESTTPNRTVTKQSGKPGGTIVSRRVVTNRSTRTMDQVVMRLVDLSQPNGLPGSSISGASTVAALRAVAPSTPTVTLTVAGQPVTVRQLTPSGSGLNALFPVPLPNGKLAPGESVAVSLTFQADTGGQFWFRYLAEGHPAA